VWTKEQRDKYALSKEERQEYHLVNREKHLTQMREYYQNNKEKMKMKAKEWTKNHPDKVKEIMIKANKKYRQTHPEIVGIRDRKHRDKRERGLKYISLNEPFESSVGHHIDKLHVVYIPKELHLSVYHNVWTGQGMKEINFKVFKWLEDRNIYIAQLPLITTDVYNYA
jgi:hypothetical protein